MARTFLVVSLAVLVGACGKAAKTDTTPTGGGRAATDSTRCEPGRCLEDISRLVAERKTDSRACYDAGRKRDPKMHGKVIINFAIDSEGGVGETEQGMQEEQIEDAELVTCLGEVIKTIRFPASPGGKTARAYHRFELTP